MSKYRELFVWDKWEDPLNPEIDDDNISMESWSEDYTEEVQKPKPIRTLVNPHFGIIPIVDANSPGKLFNFWVCHTGVTITSKIAEIIELVDGVETLDVFSRYRFRIAVGKCFQNKEVMDEIEQKITSYIEKTHAKANKVPAESDTK